MVILTIAGSDPSSGAGIQADLKTFSVLGVYGCSVITAITIQNTSKISKIFPLPPDLVVEQIKTIIDDIKINSIKVGVVYNKRIIECIHETLKLLDVPIVVDPIFFSSNKVELLKSNSLNYYINKILPLATIITPNIKEAELISKIKIHDKASTVKSLNLIKTLGPKNVIVKGINLKKKQSIDILLDEDKIITEFSNPWQKNVENHGSGCNFSAAITSFITKGYDIKIACELANQVLYHTLKNTIQIGRGLSIVDTSVNNYLKSFKYQVLLDLTKAIGELQEIKQIGILVPETQINFVYAIPGADSINDIAGVKGRIVKIGSKVKPSSCVEFGASKHVAYALLAYMNIELSIRSAINIKYDKRILEICKRFLKIDEYERTLVPIEVEETEGS
jgi:hydroxymethylpyrimidine/phosphomethylpyrimidine kinase